MRAPPDRAERPRRCGFTLIELLIALVLSGIVVSIIFQLLLAESRFARLQGARQEVQQNVRVVTEILGSELRGVGADALLNAAPGTIRFIVPRAWGLVCGYPPPLNGSRTLAVIFPAAAVPRLRNASGARGDALAIPVPPAVGTADWQFLDVQDRTDDPARLAEAVASCAALGPDPPVGNVPWSQSRVRYFAAAAGQISDQLTPGDPVYLYDPPVRYAVETSAPGNEWWIKRSYGGQMHPMAGPVSAKDGLTFTYFDGAGNDITAAIAANTRSAREVRSVGVRVVTHSRASVGGRPQVDTASTRVFLRNRY